MCVFVLIHCSAFLLRHSWTNESAKNKLWPVDKTFPREFSPVSRVFPPVFRVFSPDLLWHNFSKLAWTAHARENSSPDCSGKISLDLLCQIAILAWIASLARIGSQAIFQPDHRKGYVQPQISACWRPQVYWCSYINILIYSNSILLWLLFLPNRSLFSWPCESCTFLDGWQESVRDEDLQWCIGRWCRGAMGQYGRVGAGTYLWVPMAGLMEHLPKNIWFRVASWLRKAPFCLGNLDLERDHLGTAGIGQRIYGCGGSDGCIHQETTFASDGKKISLVMPIMMQHPLSAASTELWMSLVRWWRGFFCDPRKGNKRCYGDPNRSWVRVSWDPVLGDQWLRGLQVSASVWRQCPGGKGRASQRWTIQNTLW